MPGSIKRNSINAVPEKRDLNQSQIVKFVKIITLVKQLNSGEKLPQHFNALLKIKNPGFTRGCDIFFPILIVNRIVYSFYKLNYLREKIIDYFITEIPVPYCISFNCPVKINTGISVSRGCRDISAIKAAICKISSDSVY